MNHDPYNPYSSRAYFPPPPGNALNPLPGGFDPRKHGTRINFEVLNFCKALAEDPQSANIKASELLNYLGQTGIAQETLNELHAAVVKSVHAVQKAALASTSAGPKDLDAVEASDEFIDWYEPDTNKFYALDKRSGAELTAVLTRLRDPKKYKNRGIRVPNRMLFVGGAGTGKTTGAKYLGSQLNMPVALIRLDGVGSSLADKKPKQIRAAFEAATARESIIFIDEFEAIAVSRSNAGPNTPQWSLDVTSALLQLFDSLPEDQIVIGATNVPDRIDASILRRLRKHVKFFPPDRETRASMIAKWWERAPHQGPAKKRLLDLTEGYSGDVLERACEEANSIATDRFETAQITVADVEQAMASILAIDGANVRELDQSATTITANEGANP